MNEETLLIVSVVVVALVFVLLVVIFFWTFFTTKLNKRNIAAVERWVHDSFRQKDMDFRLYIILADIASALHELDAHEGWVTIGEDEVTAWEKNLRAELHKMHERLAG